MRANFAVRVPSGVSISRCSGMTPGRGDPFRLQPLLDIFGSLRIEADDMRALMTFQEVRDARGGPRRIFAGQDFQVVVGEHHAAIAGTLRLHRLARFPGGRMGRIGRELEAHRLEAPHGVGKIPHRHAYVVEIVDIGQGGRQLTCGISENSRKDALHCTLN